MAAPPQYTAKDLLRVFGHGAIERHPEARRLLTQVRALTLQDVHFAYLYNCTMSGCSDRPIVALVTGTINGFEHMDLRELVPHFERALQESEAWQQLLVKPRCYCDHHTLGGTRLEVWLPEESET